MSRYDDIAHAYIAAWNAHDAAARRDAVDAAFTADATYTDPLATVAGRAAIAALIAGAQERFTGWTFRLAGPVDGHHDQARFTWTLGPGDEEPVAGSDTVVLDGDGRIAAVFGFLDRMPAAA